MLSWGDHLRTVVVLAAGLLLFMLGMPGVSFLKRAELRSEEDRTAIVEGLGPIGSLFVHLADFNRDVRLPFADRYGGVQRPFRISQTWHLYRDGPSRVRRLEVWADDHLLHRSGDPSQPWRAAQLRNRRFRPVVESAVRKETGRNWRGLARFVVSEVRSQYPTIKRIELRAVWQRFPGTEKGELHHGWYAEAPSWTPRKMDMAK